MNTLYYLSYCLIEKRKFTFLVINSKLIFSADVSFYDILHLKRSEESIGLTMMFFFNL